MRLTRITRQLGFILGAQWTRDLSWTIFTILLARYDKSMMGQLQLALSAGYLVKTIADVGLNDFLLSSFARRDGRPTVLLGQVTWLKLCVLFIALAVTWVLVLPNSPEQRLVMLIIAAGFGLDGVSDSFFALCQARGRQDVEMRIRIPSALIGIGYGIACVVLQLPLLAIVLYKPIESVCCATLAVLALGHNPLRRMNWESLRELAAKMKNGVVFTLMACCTMCYNKINVFFLADAYSEAEVASYSVAWETVEGLSVLVSSALLGKVIFPLLARYWQENREAFRHLAGQTARSLWAAALPVIFLTASSDEFTTVAGIQMGADDYISKPFRPRELLARVAATIRRSQPAKRVIAFGPLAIDTDRAHVERNGCEVVLSALEYRLLLLFATHQGSVITRDQIRDALWDDAGTYIEENTLSVYIKRLRDKIEDNPAHPRLIATVRGLGYKALG